jgi:hypothetical protein
VAVVEDVRESAFRPGPQVIPQAKSRPVIGWAMVGALFLAFEIYVLASWVIGPDFKRVPVGVSAPPGWMKVVMNGWTVGGLLAVVFFAYWFVVRPKRRDGRLSTDSLLCIGFALIWWQDPLLNYSGNWFTYNSYLFNMGSWTNQVPGWLAPGSPGHLVAEPLLWTPAVYVYAAFGVSVLAGGVMRRAKARWPQLGTVGLIAICWLFIVTIDIVLEGLIWMPLGFYTYAGGHSLLNPSHYYKFPVEEALFFGSTWTAWACLRFFKNDKGQTLVERGVDSVRASSRQKTLLRFLALFGGINVIFMVIFNVPVQWVGTHSATWPTDIQKRSYLLDGLCGQGTTLACPGEAVPIPRGNTSVRIGADGRLVVPAGPSASPPGPSRHKR